MTDFVWSHSERRDLFLASRILSEGTHNGDWVQWASDTLLEEIELYDDPLQGAYAWLFDDEVSLANDLGERLWGMVQSDPFSAAELLAVDSTTSGSVRTAATNLVVRMAANGRSFP